MSNRLSQAYLFVCPDRLTNTNLISLVAKLLVCENKNACDDCANCKKVNAGTHPDILIYPKTKNFSVEDAGNIYETVFVKPMLAERKVFVINNFDLATEQAQNKMLKIIEEPPQNVVFLIGASVEGKVLKTIHSRVQKIHVNKISEGVLSSIINAEEKIKQIALYNGDGYFGKTLEIINNNEFLKNYENMQKILINLKNSSQIPAFSGYFSENKLIFENDLYILSDFFRDLLMLKVNKQNLIKNKNLINVFETVQDEYSELALVQIIKNLNYVKQKLESNVNLTVLADGMLLEILEVKFLCK